jgi:hypothetical protein
VPQSTLPQNLSRFSGDRDEFDAAFEDTAVDNARYTEARTPLMWQMQKQKAGTAKMSGKERG